ncbi:MAG: phenylacetate--CoA ligase [Oscillospiraceae bacterium]|nr:phenylacetate--CoA ligase [Oscillospiraceae bacterium]MCI9364358.1 phenylacetate--CoA ligase [Oscillospiraceae bacterium]RKJ58201.1 phenylacetate--CoA ligase family protein [bacterium 1XD42-8]RKJ66967.1 phenylacetate--CoA ligase family protein [bacterium 1XD42-1]
MIYNKEMETMSRADMEALQLERLKYIVRYCYDHVKLYHDRFDENGISPDKIKTLSDIQYIPPTTKDDMRDHYPFGLFAVPRKEVVRIHASSGTTGKPTVVGYTKNDLSMWSENMARLIAAAGVTEEDIAQICFGYGLFTGALGLHYGLERLGAAVVPSSSGNSEKQIMLMKDFGTTTLIATPTYALYLGELAKELGYTREDFRLRIGLFGSEGCTTELRAKIEENLGLFATDNYGMSELMGPGVSGECHLRCGLHINEDHFLAEIVDPQTLEAKGEGETGELVVTTLTKECLPLLRYRTRDLTRIVKTPCECGRTTARMDKVMGRSDDMLKIKGVNVFPSQIESVLMAFKEMSSHYMLYVRRENFTDNLEVQVELSDASLVDRYKALENLRSSIRAKLKTVLGIDAKVTLVQPKTIERFAGKAKRVVDLRNEKA